MILTKSKYYNPQAFIINDYVTNGKVDKFVCIVPTNRKVRQLKKDFIDNSPNKTVSKSNVETLTTISIKLFRSIFGNFNILSDTASSVILNNCFLKSELNYFSTYKNGIPKGTLDRINNVIKQYKRYGISPQKLFNEAESLSGSAKRKAQDIAEVFKLYQEELQNINSFEVGDIYSKLVSCNYDEILLAFNGLFGEVDFISVEDFTEFSSLEIQLTNILSNVVGDKLFVKLEYENYNTGLFSHLAGTVDSFAEYGFKEYSNADAQNKYRDYLSGKLFSNDEMSSLESKSEGIFEIITQTPETEIASVAKEIKLLLSNSEVKPSHICVVFNLIDDYSAIIRDKFSSYGIPLNLTDRFLLKSFPPIVTVVSLLEVAEKDFYYKNVFRLLSSDFYTPKFTNLSDMMNCSAELKIVSGYNTWRQSINTYKKSLLEDEIAKSTLYQNILDEIEQIKKIIHPFEQEMTIEEFINAFEKLIFDLRLPQIMLEKSIGYEEENLKALSTLIDKTKEIFFLLKSSFEEDKKFELGYFIQQLKVTIDASRFNIKERSNYGVLVTTINEIRGFNFDYLFICGLVDGDFPTRFSPEIIQSKHYPRFENLHRAEEQYNFYLTLLRWNKRLYLTHPLTRKDSELVTSNFLTALQNVFFIQRKFDSDYNDFIFSEDEFLIHGGIDKNILDGENHSSILTKIKNHNEYRNHLDNDNEFMGVLNKNSELSTVLESYSKKNYSISQLETYAKCPFKYFAERLLFLKPPIEPKEEIEAFELGSLLHEILFEFYKKITEQSKIVYGCSDADFSSFIKLIFNIANEKIMEYDFNSPLSFFEKEKILGVENDISKSILYNFLIKEREDDSGFIPSFFELTFGKKTSQDAEDYEIIEVKTPKQFNLSGKIDRIDISSDQKYYRIIDYKSGRAEKSEIKNNILNGLSLQLPVYLYAAKLVVAKKLAIDAKPAVASIFSLKMADDELGLKNIDISNTKKDFHNSTDEGKSIILENNQKLIDETLVKIEDYIGNISDGKFNLSRIPKREEKVCNYCDFKGVCRVSELTSDPIEEL